MWTYIIWNKLVFYYLLCYDKRNFHTPHQTTHLYIEFVFPIHTCWVFLYNQVPPGGRQVQTRNVETTKLQIRHRIYKKPAKIKHVIDKRNIEDIFWVCDWGGRFGALIRHTRIDSTDDVMSELSGTGSAWSGWWVPVPERYNSPVGGCPTRWCCCSELW